MNTQGILKIHPKGFGFVQTEQGSVFVPPGLAKRFFPFDVVSAVAEPDGKPEPGWIARELSLMERTHVRVAGTAQQQKAIWMFVPEIPTLPSYPLDSQGIALEEGDHLVGTPTLTPSGWQMQTVDRIGPREEPHWHSKLSMSVHGLRPLHEHEQQLPVAVEPSDIRQDRTDLLFVTIDSASTTDIDDAICVVNGVNGWKLHIAIADASAYVTEQSPLDTLAMDRGTTVYFHQQVLPMLPKNISSEAGSLWPHAKKAVLLCEMHVAHDGTLSNVSIQEAWISSKAKLDYPQVTQVVTVGASTGDTAIDAQLHTLHQMYQALLARRLQRGGVPIRSGDYTLSLDAKGVVESVQWKPWQLSYGLVEECMLAANTGVAQWMKERNLTGLYRHHRGPDENHWAENALPYLRHLGLDDASDNTPHHLQHLLEKSKTLGEHAGMENVIRSAMRPATYTFDASSHFSLAYEHYTHFTSPLRRYADLTVHRILKRALRGLDPMPIAHIEAIAQQCTAADKRAKKATREEEKRLKAQYLQQYCVGQTLAVEVTSGNRAGVFVKSVLPPLDGFLSLSGTLWSWNPVTQAMEHQEGLAEPIKPGQPIEITLTGVELEKNRLHMQPLTERWAPSVVALPSSGPP